MKQTKAIAMREQGGAVRKIAVTLISIFAVALLPVVGSKTALAKNPEQGIWPKSIRVHATGPHGEEYLAIPLGVYLEYGYGRSRSTSGSTDDVRRNRFTFGADFMTSRNWRWGVALAYTDVHDSGTQPFVSSLETNKHFTGGSFYVDAPIAPFVRAGVGASYNGGNGSSLYNRADLNNESSDHYGVSPYVKASLPLSDIVWLTVGAGVNFNFARFDYDNNVPPTAEKRSTVARLPVGVIYKWTDHVSLMASARLNQILARNSFDNAPQLDPTTVTLSGGVQYAFDNGIAVYGNLSHDVFDDVYDSTQFNVGLIVPAGLIAGIASTNR